MQFAETIFEAQLMFLNAIKSMIEDEEVFLDGDEEIGFKMLHHQFQVQSARLTDGREVTTT